MKKMILTMSATLLFMIGYAQKEIKTPQDRASNRTEKMSEALDDLSAQQKSDVYQLMLKKVNALQRIEQDLSLSEDQKTENKKEVKKLSRKELKTILSAQQLDKWHDYKEMKRQERKIRKSPEQKADRMISKMDEVVGGLSNEQIVAIKPILLDKIMAIKIIKKDATLTEEDKKAKIKPIRQKARKEINTVLNTDQKKKWKVYKKTSRGKINQLED